MFGLVALASEYTETSSLLLKQFDLNRFKIYKLPAVSSKSLTAVEYQDNTPFPHILGVSRISDLAGTVYIK